MQDQNFNIDQEIDRILSSTVDKDAFVNLTLSRINSPISKKNYKSIQNEIQTLIRSPVDSAQKYEIEEDLYEKALQILKLKQTLESQLGNINQIMKENQILTQTNIRLKMELKNMKNQWKLFQVQIFDQLKQTQIKINNSKQTIQQKLQEVSQLIHTKQYVKINENMQIRQIKEFQIISFQHHQLIEGWRTAKNMKLRINSKVIKQNFFQIKYCSEQKYSQTGNQYEDNLTNEKMKLQKQIILLKEAIKQLQKGIDNLKNKQTSLTLTSLSINIKQKVLQQKSANQPNVQCYKSLFLKSVSSEDQNPDQFIRSILFNSEKPLFQQLEQSKYSGKIVYNCKNGKGIDQYRNSFKYQGQFFKNQRHGMGHLSYKQKNIYSGSWKQGKFHGKGVVYYHSDINVLRVEGNFRNGTLQGFSTLYFKSGAKIRTFIKNTQLAQSATLIIQELNNKSQRQQYSGKVRKNFIGQEQKQNLIFKDTFGKTICYK